MQTLTYEDLDPTEQRLIEELVLPAANKGVAHGLTLAARVIQGAYQGVSEEYESYRTREFSIFVAAVVASFTAAAKSYDPDVEESAEDA